jgi:hypothetical protein
VSLTSRTPKPDSQLDTNSPAIQDAQTTKQKRSGIFGFASAFKNVREGELAVAHRWL